jgi:fructokinase
MGTGPDDLSDPIAFPTTTPEETLARVVGELRRAGDLAAAGFASFGPVDLRLNSATYGHMLDTPKPGWSGAPVLAAVESGLGVPVGFDTDVNGAALGERRWGAAAGLDTFVYLTVGTGIGGAAVVDGKPLHGVNHPEMGHMRVPRRPGDDFPGICPFHGDCLEGMAAGPAIAARWGRPGQELGADTAAAAEIEAWYLGTAVANLILTLSPQRVILGGGVPKMPGLLEGVRRQFVERLGGYVTLPEVLDAGTYLVPPGLGDRAGVLGGVALAEAAVAQAGSGG